MEKNRLGRLLACGPALDARARCCCATSPIRTAWRSRRTARPLVHRELEPPAQPRADRWPRHRSAAGRSSAICRAIRRGLRAGAGRRLLARRCSRVRTHLVEFVLREDDFREEMMRTIPPAYWIAPALATSSDCHEPMQFGSIKALGIEKPWAPPRSYGLVVRIDERWRSAGEPAQPRRRPLSRHHRRPRDGAGAGDRLQGQRPGAAGQGRSQRMNDAADRAARTAADADRRAPRAGAAHRQRQQDLRRRPRHRRRRFRSLSRRSSRAGRRERRRQVDAVQGDRRRDPADLRRLSIVDGKPVEFDSRATRSPPASAWSTRKPAWCRP